MPVLPVRTPNIAHVARAAAKTAAERSRRPVSRLARDRERRSVRRARLLLLLLLPRLLLPVEPEAVPLVPLALVEKRVVAESSKGINLDGRGPARSLVRVVHSLLQRCGRSLDDLRVRFGAVSVC